MLKLIVRLLVCISAVFGMIAPSDISAVGSLPKELRIDYSDYNQLSLVLKKFGWLEKEFQADKVPVRWVYSTGSTQGLKDLTVGSVDFASTSALPCLLCKVQGHPVKPVYIFSHPEWVTLLVTRDSPINSVLGLKGKKIAVTPDSDPYVFLLQALNEAGLCKSDITIIPMSLSEGRKALEMQQVDAWAGSDPFISSSQLELGSRAIYRNAAFNSYGLLNTTESFAARYPDTVDRVVKVYERVRKWAIRHPDELALIYADESGISLQIAKLILSRIDFSRTIPDSGDIVGLKEVLPILVQERMLDNQVEADRLIEHFDVKVN
ncbi:aliphatic sulfonate ABC transporter substrate-binding protein [Chlorobium sp. KB01]|uniref:aliphatic sulfonate ABC transporter substrate-binding protein n=1 Tax=Chlorobium sp. KB01 TaxID=1917528 RepID=UPI0009782C82|nr:aliphatic sulfonate ABC transporter substrate-binding protein [Chlorobium sp. KB01]